MHAIVSRPAGSPLIQMRILMTAGEANTIAEMLKSEVQDLEIFLGDKDEDEPDQYNRIDYDFESFVKGEVNDD
jgi:hypothetical protein